MGVSRGEVKVHAGDFRPGSGICTGKILCLKTDKHRWWGENIQISEIAAIDVASEENVGRLADAVGMGLVAGALLGPLGLIAGAVAGGRGKDVTFVATFRDGRRLLATTDSETYTRLAAVLFR